MASTYTNSLTLTEIGTGDQAGTWGTTTNTNIQLIERAKHRHYGRQPRFLLGDQQLQLNCCGWGKLHHHSQLQSAHFRSSISVVKHLGQRGQHTANGCFEWHRAYPFSYAGVQRKWRHLRVSAVGEHHGRHAGRGDLLHHGWKRADGVF